MHSAFFSLELKARDGKHSPTSLDAFPVLLLGLPLSMYCKQDILFGTVLYVLILFDITNFMQQIGVPHLDD